MTRLFLLLLAVLLSAQEPKFGTQTRIVLVPVAVNDRLGQPVDGLEAADFQILDNDRPQKFQLDPFGTGVAPMALTIAVQASGLSETVLEHVWKVGPMIQPLITGEYGCASVVSFSEHVNWIEPDCTKDPERITRALRKIRPSYEMKAGRMLDAAKEAIDRLGKRTDYRRILLLISESRDRGSEADINAVALAAQEAGVTVYAATYSALLTAMTNKTGKLTKPQTPKAYKRPQDVYNTRDGTPQGKFNPYVPPPEQRADLLAGLIEVLRLRQPATTEVLASFTGGDTLGFTREKGLQEVIERLGQDLHTQYLLSFRPENPAPGFHRLVVLVANQTGFRIRTRAGYWWNAQP